MTWFRLAAVCGLVVCAGSAAAQQPAPQMPTTTASANLGMTHADFMQAFNASASAQQLPVRAIQRACLTQERMNICQYQFGRTTGMAGTAPSLPALDTVMVRVNSDGMEDAVHALAAFTTLMMIFEPRADAAERGTVFSALMPARGGRLQPGVAMLRRTQFQILQDVQGSWFLVVRRPG